MQETIIQNCKYFINNSDLLGLQEYYETITEEKVNFDFIFQKVYLHACLKKKIEIVEWLQTIFKTLEPISQIAMRQIFSYGRHLLSLRPTNI